MSIFYAILLVIHIFGAFVWLGMGYRPDGFRWKDLITIPTIILFWPFLLAISIGMAIRKAAEELKKESRP